VENETDYLIMHALKIQYITWLPKYMK